MIARAAILAGGLVTGVTTAQLPEYSQQYLQRLGGVVDGLSAVVAAFDASAKAEGMDRKEALEALQGTPFLDRRRADMETTFARHTSLTAELETLRRAGPYQRSLRTLARLDPALGAATLRAYRPAVPVTAEGLLFGLSGLVLGGGLARLLLGALRGVFSRRGKPVA